MYVLRVYHNDLHYKQLMNTHLVKVYLLIFVDLMFYNFDTFKFKFPNALVELLFKATIKETQISGLLYA